ncbi:GntR family transcriptional regulator [Thalassospira lohafexi]|uniref:GntR family transcriptional regulator n=1 Tax=Thalassospira lohafexi TaxID=744227 RepID=UPI001055AB3A|nr:GntR family transcriptional regulator [Thalassospira lohafexi]
MARSDRKFKTSFNTWLDSVSIGNSPDTISGLARLLVVSRTLARRVLERAIEINLISSNSFPIVLLRQPQKSDYFPISEIRSLEERLETDFMMWLKDAQPAPGSRLSEAALARRFGVSNTAIREFLIGLSRVGFIRKEPQRSWILEGFTEQYALELHEVRRMFECRAIRAIFDIPEDEPFWGKLLRLRQEHIQLRSEIDTRFTEFSELDTRFHRTLNAAAGNRFMDGFQDSISVIFHFHYRWSKKNQVGRNGFAVQEHLEIIDAILRQDQGAATAALERHLETAHQTFIASLQRD